MEREEMEELVSSLESDRVERKPFLGSQGREIREAICAFANDLPGHQRPGVVFVGLADDGNCAAIEVTDALLQKLANIQGEGTILPMPALQVERSSLRGCDLAVVTVEPVAAPPVRYKGRVFVRIGPTTRIASPEEERILAERRRSRDLPFDLRPASSAGLEDLDLEMVRSTYLPAAIAPEILAENERPLELQLTSLRLATPGSPQRPTNLGIVVAGRDPTRFVPGDYIQFLRIAGTSLTDPIKDQKEIDGPLVELLRRLDELLELNVSVATDLTSGPKEIRRPDYPLLALRQLALNAVMHRNYEGSNTPVRITWFEHRVEIQSPGGPYGQVTRESFGRPGVTDYRNPNLAAAMKDLGYVQRFGVGLPTARKALEDNGNPHLELTVEDTYVLAVVRSPS